MDLKARIRARKSSERGFSLIELLVVILVLGVVAAMAIPTWQRMQKNARLNGDAHNLSEVLSIAKLRAGASFTESRVFFYTGTGTPYVRVDVWNPKVTNGAGTTACWVPDGKAAAGLTQSDCIADASATGYETSLSIGVTAGYGSLSTAPSNFVTSLAQAGNCIQGGTGPQTGGSAISNTSCIVFNSRGFPSVSGGFYITDGTRTYGIVSNSTGLIKVYVSPASTADWKPY